MYKQSWYTDKVEYYSAIKGTGTAAHSSTDEQGNHDANRKEPAQTSHISHNLIYVKCLE